MSNETNLIIIPVRTGSKGVPDKNFKMLYNLPLFMWTVLAAKTAVDSAHPSRGEWTIIITTNAKSRVKQLLFQYVTNAAGIHVYERHPKLAQDHVQVDEVVLDVVRTYEATKDIELGSVIVLQPTSPFREPHDIVETMGILVLMKRGSVIGTHRPTLREAHLYKGLVDNPHQYWWETKKPHESTANLLPGIMPVDHNPAERFGRQWEEVDRNISVPEVVEEELGENGTVWWLFDYSVETGSIYGFKAAQFSMTRYMRMQPHIALIEENAVRAIDIDTHEDWRMAEESISLL